jgi:ribonucleoside-triphosphate reductase (thioredoxin)
MQTRAESAHRSWTFHRIHPRMAIIASPAATLVGKRGMQEEERIGRVDKETARAFEASATYFPTGLQQFQFFNHYSRYDPARGRRETWLEAVDRAVSFLAELADGRLDPKTIDRVRSGILEMKVMPSMRLLAMAGPAARRSHIAIYNCSYQPVDGLETFHESLAIVMEGCGVGYSVEGCYLEQLPPIAKQKGGASQRFVVPDTADGWVAALRLGINAWFEGEDVVYDLSSIRPAGTPIVTRGGRASGPEPFRIMLDAVRARILSRQGERLRPLDAHDIMCSIGGAVTGGGVRRTAMIALFDADDHEMRTCKDGDFEAEHSVRWNANNSAVWAADIDRETFERAFLEMVASGRGEPGIFSRAAALATRPGRRLPAMFGTNPCGEIVLRPRQFCNLSAAIARSGDTLETLREKVELAAIIGTIQALATNFPGLRPEWAENARDERLLGVDITGQMDCVAVQDAAVQRALREHAVQVNRELAAKLGINAAAAVTCVKPSGNTSQLVDCSSGLHPRWSRYYVRNVRLSALSPLFHVLRDAGVPMDPENGQTAANATTWVVHFPVKAPEGSLDRHAFSAVDSCNYWLKCKQAYTEHNPSCTITYAPDEVPALIDWVWRHRTLVGGLAFLPKSEAKYRQLPYEEISAEDYESRAGAFPRIDFSRLCLYEKSDTTTLAQEKACASGTCEISVYPGAPDDPPEFALPESPVARVEPGIPNLGSGE